MKQRTGFTRLLKAVNQFMLFFIIVSFVTTCTMTLFLNIMGKSMDLTYSSGDIQMAAKLTFGNVVLLSLIFYIVDVIRRKHMVDRPIQMITDAANKMMQGDFSIRIPQSASVEGQGFDQIIDCFNKMAQELSGTETLRTDFIANVSHELKTPLAVMQNYGTLLQQPGLSESQRMEYAKAITDASRRLASLITNILKLNKLENQQLLPATEVYDLTEQLCQCLLSFEDLWEKKQLQIETDLEDQVQVKSDPEMMTLVWNNLLSNAIKFTEPGGTISLAVRTEGDRAIVKIADTGCGISQEVGARMFDKFYQGDTSHATQGNGLGLALVKRVIDITGSDISVESALGKGTVFTVRLERYKDGEV